jgi:hypothetical protein
VSAPQSSTSVEEVGSGGIFTTAVTIEAPAPGFLCVRVVTDQSKFPVKDLTIKFYPSDTSGAIKGDQIGADATTDNDGVAGVDRRLPPGYFACVVDGITTKVRPIDVDTYAKASLKPYVIGLPRGFIAVKLLFRDLPLQGFKVKFFAAGADGAKTGAALGAQLTPDKSVTTGADGVASLGRNEFKLANYVCEVEGKYTAAVSTIEDARRPYVLALPLVRPLLEHKAPGRVLEASDVPERPDPSSGFLSVKVMFRGVPLIAVKVTFFASDATGKASTDEPKGEALTDDLGIATLDSKAKLGNYFCQVEGQNGYASISTVDDARHPYVISLPFVRPLLAHRALGSVRDAEVVERPDQISGYLSVKVLFRGAPINGIKVNFFATDANGKAATDQPKGDAITDSDGIATLLSKASLGNYFCQIEGQAGFSSISTVQDKNRPYIVMLPAGRPFIPLNSPGQIAPQAPVEEREPGLMAYLSVMLYHRDAPVVGARVHFFPSTPNGTADAGQPKGEAMTDQLGIAALAAKAKVGNYFCQVEGVPGYTSISTVEDKDVPYPVKLPPGRAYLVHMNPAGVPETTTVEEEESPS